MGKVFSDKKCDICGLQGKVIETWGKNYCRPCWNKKPKGTIGHSGMIKIPGFAYEDSLPFEAGLNLVAVPKGDRIFSNLYLRHYPESKGIVGRQCNYIIKFCGHIVGIIGANSPPLHYKVFDNYFGVGKEKNYLNNNVFRLTDHDKNLGTKVLRLFRKKIKRDYKQKYGDELRGLVTFVEPPRIGTVYKADNWTYLGETQGKKCTRRGDHGKWINKEWSTGTQKLIFAYKFNE